MNLVSTFSPALPGIEYRDALSLADETCAAGEAIIVNRWVERRADGKVYHATNQSAKINRCIGMAIQSADPEGSVKIRKQGRYFFNGFGLAPETNYFLTGTGEMTATPPSTGFIQCLGSSADENTFDINIQLPIAMGA